MIFRLMAIQQTSMYMPMIYLAALRLSIIRKPLDGSWVSANTTQTDGGTFNFSNKYTGFTVFEYKADNGS